MKISMIAAITNNKVIGIKNNIPWKLKKDMIWFKKKTINKYIIIGRKTSESIKKKLKKRKKIIISKKKKKKIKFKKLFNNLKKKKKKIIIIGGRKIYKKTFKYIKILYLTKININLPGDIFFPNINLKNWKLVYSKYYKPCKINFYSYSFNIYTM
ncbi:dihydrofolate reductase [Buchnera aphidicola]|uniref:dihydrofolate reductase n=1 Tax=Buchnera aphidicola TaxID=9 RepID=UPI0031B85DB4